MICVEDLMLHGKGSGNVGVDNSEIMNYSSLKVKESGTEFDILQFWQKMKNITL